MAKFHFQFQVRQVLNTGTKIIARFNNEADAMNCRSNLEKDPTNSNRRFAIYAVEV